MTAMWMIGLLSVGVIWSGDKKGGGSGNKAVSDILAFSKEMMITGVMMQRFRI